MRLELQNHTARVVEGSKPELDWLFSYLVIKTTDWARDPYTGRVSYNGEKHEHLLDYETNEFPAGFTPMVARKGREQGFDVEVADRRVRPGELDAAADLAWLRDYQHGALQAALARTRGILQCPTGSGKTELFAGLLRVLPTVRWLVLVHRSGLMRDIGARIAKRAREHGHPEPDIGYYGDGDKEIGHRITVATFASLKANVKNPRVKLALRGMQGLIVDEAHTLAADTFARVVGQCPNAYYRIGVSGTPLARGDKRSSITVGLLGPVIYKVTAEHLIDRGVLARPTVRMCRFDAEEIYSGLWNVVRTRGITESVGRNRAVLSAAMRAQKPALVFVDLLQHGRLLNTALQRAGVNSDFVWGVTKTEERAKAIKKLVRGEVDVIVCSTVFNEGIDIPSLASVVLAAGGKSVIATLQRIGRGMRREDGKATFEIWDFEDRHHRILEEHYLVRKRAYRKEGHAIEIDVADLQLQPPVRVR